MDAFKSSKATKLTFKGRGEFIEGNPKESWRKYRMMSTFRRLDGCSLKISTISADPYSLFSYRNSTFALSADEDKGVYMAPLECTDIKDCEPESVTQVFYIIKLPVSSHGETTYSIKTSSERYVTCDKFGGLFCDQVAVGPYEEWVLVQRPDGFSFMSAAYKKFLEAIPDASSVRCDSESVGSMHTWNLKCQAQEIRRRKLEELEKTQKDNIETVDPRIAELEQIKKFHSRLAGKLSEEQVDKNIQSLKSAQKRGRLNEALLDRREKMKSDKYCK